MLASNIIKNIKQQNWGAASIDFIVVVLGIFVAIQVNSWNQDRINKQKEKVILEQLYSEFSKNVDDINNMATFHKKKATEIDFVIDMVATDSIDTGSERVKNALISMFQMPPITASMGTYKSLIATGDISLIRDQQLKSLLVELEASLESEKSMLNYFRQLNIIDIEYIRGLVTLASNEDKTDTVLTVNYERFQEDKNLLILVAGQERNHLVFTRIRTDVAQQFEKVKTYIGNALEDM